MLSTCCCITVLKQMQTELSVNSTNPEKPGNIFNYMHTEAGKLLLRVQVILVRTTAIYIIALLQLGTAGEPGSMGVDSSWSGYKSGRITQMSQNRCSHC